MALTNSFTFWLLHVLVHPSVLIGLLSLASNHSLYHTEKLQNNKYIVNNMDIIFGRMKLRMVIGNVSKRQQLRIDSRPTMNYHEVQL